MYLTKLSEREKELFLNLANAVVLADGQVVEQELSSLNYYSREMNFPYCMKNEISNLDEILNELREKSTDEIKRVFLLELLALAFADKDYAEAEEEILKKICAAFGFSNSVYFKTLYLVVDYLSDLDKMGKFIEKGF